MTLSPVFRSLAAVEALRTEGVWDRLAPAAAGQSAAIARVMRDLPLVLEDQFIDHSGMAQRDSTATAFHQEFFFLILFRSVMQTLRFSETALQLCSELNFCIKGTITAADNLFDDQDKALLPLGGGQGARFHSILQLLAFERLTTLALDRGIASGALSAGGAAAFQKTRLSRMATIGSLEGSEEGGVTNVPDPAAMIDAVHRVRGGALFELAFIAPALVKSSVDPTCVALAQAAISRLGTAFQIVDDLTDFEGDVTRGTHNLLVAQITHHGSSLERSKLAQLRLRHAHDGDVVIDAFLDSARLVMQFAEQEARQSLRDLQELGFWFSPALSDLLIRAIVGLEGVGRMRAL